MSVCPAVSVLRFMDVVILVILNRILVWQLGIIIKIKNLQKDALIRGFKIKNKNENSSLIAKPLRLKFHIEREGTMGYILHKSPKFYNLY